MEINQAQARNQNQLSEQESGIADNFHNCIAKSLSGGAAIKSIMFQLGDGVDVILGRIDTSLVWQ